MRWAVELNSVSRKSFHRQQPLQQFHWFQCFSTNNSLNHYGRMHMQRCWFSSKPPNENDLTLFVACLPGMEAVLSHELKALSIPHSPTEAGANLRQASIDTITKCHLFCGSASHVFLRCGKAFNIRGFPDLTRKVSRIPWEYYIQTNAMVKVRATCAKSKLYHTTAVEQRVRTAINKALGRSNSTEAAETETDTNPGDVSMEDVHAEDIDESDASFFKEEAIDAPTVAMMVRIHRDVVQISIDTSLTPLHQRGYRLQTAKAPLREDIAYSMLYAAGLRDFQHLCDPMCGSGTIAIEAAALKLGLPPGRLRDIPLNGTQFYSPDLWNRYLKKALEDSEVLAKEIGSQPIVTAGDRDQGAIQAAIANADRAGVLNFIDFSARSLSDHVWDKSSASTSILVATNPPFGKRVSSSREKSSRRFQELLPLYQTLGHKISKTPGQVGTVVLTNNVDLVRRMALKDTKVLFSTQHGGLPVAAMGYNLQSPIFADSVKIIKKAKVTQEQKVSASSSCKKDSSADLEKSTL